MGKPTAGANLWSELADRQARRLAEGQTTHSALHMGGCRPPRLRAHLLGYSWLVKVLLSAHLIILVGVPLTCQTMYF